MIKVYNQFGGAHFTNQWTSYALLTSDMPSKFMHAACYSSTNEKDIKFHS